MVELRVYACVGVRELVVGGAKCVLSNPPPFPPKLISTLLGYHKNKRQEIASGGN